MVSKKRIPDVKGKKNHYPQTPSFPFPYPKTMVSLFSGLVLKYLPIVELEPGQISARSSLYSPAYTME